MELFGFVVNILSVVGALIAIVTFFFESNTKIKIVLSILALLFIIVSSFIYLSDKQNINIIKPKVGSKIEGVINKDDQQLMINDISIRVAKRINADEKVVLLMKVQGGDEWWVTSNPISQLELNDINEASFGFVSFGRLNDNNQIYVMMACITSEEFNTKEKFQKPEKYVKTAALVKFKKVKNTIQRIE